METERRFIKRISYVNFAERIFLLSWQKQKRERDIGRERMGEQGSEPQIEVGLETKKRKRYRKREDGRTRHRATDRGWVRNKKEKEI